MSRWPQTALLSLISLGLLGLNLSRPAAAQQRQPLRYTPVPALPDGGVEQFPAEAVLFHLSGQSSDNEATFYGLWDFDNLMLAVVVRDRQLYCMPVEPDSPYAYNNDSVELNFDLLNKKTMELGDKDFRQWIFPLDYQQNPYDGYGSGNRGDVSFDGHAEVRVELQGTLNDDQEDEGYWMVIRIPWSDLDLAPQNGLVFGFDGAVNDVDSLFGSFTTMDWAELEVFAQPALWNELELSEGPSERPQTDGPALADGLAADGPAPAGGDSSSGYVTEGTGCTCHVSPPAGYDGLICALLVWGILAARRRRRSPRTAQQ